MNNKGITLISLTMYVVGITFVIIAVATLTSFFYNNIVDLRDSTDSLSEFDKFNVAFLKEIKNDEVSVINIEKTKITFSNGVTFQFQDNGIYRNYVKICEQIKDCQFSSTTMGENIVIKVYLEIGTDFAKTLEYVGNHKQNNETNKRLILTKSTEEYTNGNVIVTLNYINLPEGYEIQYKIGDNQWTAGTSVTVEENNTVVYGRIYNNITLDEKDNNSIIITNIDKEAPTAPTGIEYSVQIVANEETATLPNGWSSAKVSKVVNEKASVTVKARGGTDAGSEIVGYQYSTNGTSWTGTIAEGESYTFSGITGNTTIYARTVDKAGSLSGTYTKEVLRTAPIPVGYTASQITGENTIDGGLVIYQTTTPVTGTANSTGHVSAMETYNQYVWIPVDDINDMVMCKKNASGSICNLELQGEELVCTTHGYTTATELTTENMDTTGLAGRLYGVDDTLKETTANGNKIYQTNMQFTETTKSTQTFTKDSEYREPDIVPNCDKDDAISGYNYMELAGITDKTVATFKKQLNSDYIEMAKSVAKYGGFYIARYEAGVNGSSKKNQDVLTSATSLLFETNCLVGNMWYGLYNTLRNETGVNTNVVKSHMAWR